MTVQSLLKALNISKEFAPSRVAQAPPSVKLKVLLKCKTNTFIKS